MLAVISIVPLDFNLSLHELPSEKATSQMPVTCAGEQAALPAELQTNVMLAIIARITLLFVFIRKSPSRQCA
jgi:hypothetical protein